MKNNEFQGGKSADLKPPTMPVSMRRGNSQNGPKWPFSSPERSVFSCDQADNASSDASQFRGAVVSSSNMTHSQADGRASSVRIS